jgi:hypothetical protein
LRQATWRDHEDDGQATMSNESRKQLETFFHGAATALVEDALADNFPGRSSANIEKVKSALLRAYDLGATNEIATWEGMWCGDHEELLALADAICTMRTTFARNAHAQDWADFIEERVNLPVTCDRPPSGWWCSREPGHEGSCPTRPWKKIRKEEP